MRVGFDAPSGWTVKQAGNEGSTLLAEEGVIIRLRSGQTPQPSLAWAWEAISFSRDSCGTGPAGGARTGGFRVSLPPTEQTIKDKSWVATAFDCNLTKTGKTAEVRTEKYYWKDGHTIVEVVVMAAAAQLGRLDREKLQQLLGSVRVVGAAQPL